MESLVKDYKESVASDAVAYLEFMNAYKKDSNKIYCFYEGQEDFAYYPIRIKNIITGGSLCDFKCGGKENVIKIRNIIKSNPYYKAVKTGFFIDKDFDNNALPDDIYITPTYSIENLYCDNEVLEAILISEFKFKRDSEDLYKALKKYNDLVLEFHDKTLLLNSWLSCQADFRNNQKYSTRLNIDKKIKHFFNGVVFPDLTGISSLNEFASKEQIEAIFNNSPSILDEILNQKILHFKTVNQMAEFRGKFLLSFLISFLIRLQSIFGQNNNPFINKYTCSLRFEISTGCSSFSQYALTPQCLKSYIEKNLN